MGHFLCNNGLMAIMNNDKTNDKMEIDKIHTIKMTKWLSLR